MASSFRILMGLAVAGGIALPASGQGVVNVSDPAGLQSAINTAVDGTIIQLAAGTYAAPAGGFRITNRAVTFTIRAASGATVVLDGQNARDVLRFLNSSFGAGRPVTFERLTFANGRSATGGVAGGVTMQSAQATFVDCTFSNNATTLGSGGASVAGGSVVHFLRTTWTGNRARTFGGALTVAGAGTDVTIHDSQFLANRTNFPGHAAGAAGGAIRVANTAPGTVKLRVTSSRFEGNEAGYVGGALYAFGSWQTPLSTPAADVIVANSLFVNNKAKRDPSAPVGVPTEAGALHAENQTTARIYNSRFVNNSADTGGAIGLYRADVEVASSTFRGNRAVGTSNGFGGAVSALSNDTAADGTNNRRSARVTVRDSLFQGRYGGVTTTGRTGGCLYGAGDSNRLYGLNGASANGTAAANRATVSISGSVFSDCDVVQTAAGGGSGGAMFLDLVTLSVTDSIVINSDALAGSTTGGGTAGGGLTIINQSSATLSDSTLAGNTAGCRGGALTVWGSTVTVDGCRLVKNGVTVASGCFLPATGLGGTMFSGPMVGGGGFPNLPVSGEVRNSTITEGTGTAATMIHEDDSSSDASLINTIVYNNNQISPGTIFRNIVGGTWDVAGLNNLVVDRNSPIVDTPKGSFNTAVSSPVVGQILAVPPNRLSTAAPSEIVPTTSFLGYAWGGPATASLNGSARAGNVGLEAATSTGLQTLSVSPSSFTTTVGAASAPTATLSANPPGIATLGETSLLTWGVGGSFLETRIDQGVGTQTFPSGSVNVTPPAATTYRHFAVTKEGGALAAATVVLCSTPVIDPWAVPAAVVGGPYSERFTQTGGTGPITWGQTGSLPGGVSFNASTATLSGTPAAPGSFPFRVTTTDANGCSGSRDYTLTVGVSGPFEAMSLDVDRIGNRILEPGEVALLEPAWRRTTGTQALTGGLTFSGPQDPDPSYSAPDATASYGTVGTTAVGCAGATGDCYTVQISVPPVRPAVHWDPLARETLSSGQIKDWIVHVGGSFDDVSETSPFYPFIETLLHRSVTAGCSATGYCPTQTTTRAQMAVFVLRAKEGGGYAPPACGSTPAFGDVPASNPFCSWIEELARRGVVSGCGGGDYCPDAFVTRDQMAVFVLRTLDSRVTPPACTTPIFGDVPASSGFCRWVEELARRGVVAGCGGGNYCPTSSVTREQMGVFIGSGFDLSLYGL